MDGREIPEKIINRAGFRDDDHVDGTVYYILPEAFRREVCTGFDYRQVAGALRDRGHLIHDEGHLMTKPQLPELGLKWVYAVKATIMDEPSCHSGDKVAGTSGTTGTGEARR